MHVTVAICTWNRADLLDAALSSLAGVTIPSGVRWKVIVANNNSSDHTEAVLDKHAGRIPLVRLFVPRQGKSHALNEIVGRLDGDLVLWTDDDVQFSENWMASYVEAAQRWPEATFFGGQVVPRFLAAEPDWLRPAWEVISGVYAARELGDAPFLFDRKRLPFGANMAARVAVQRQYSYDPELGRRGDLLLAGEETSLMRQWLADGHCGVWVPQSRVEHVITPDRLELDHIRRYFFSLAESEGLSDQARGRLARFFRGFWFACRALKYAAFRCFCSRTSHPDRWMKYLTRVSYYSGRVESLWSDFPPWLKPPAIRRLKQCRRQPRLAVLAFTCPSPEAG